MPTTIMNDPNLPVVDLEGYERIFAYSSHGNAKVAHCLHIEGPIQLVLDRAHNAFVRTMNQYPRMRALKLQSKRQMAVIQPAVSVETTACLFKVVSNPSDDFWQQYLQDECNTKTDRYTQLPYSLHLIRTDGASDRIRLLLVSDHYVSDGFSGLIVLDSILRFIADPQLSAGVQSPLLSSIYSQMIPKKGVMRYLERAITKIAGPFGAKILDFLKMNTHFTPHPTLLSTKMPDNAPSFAKFATGKQGSVVKALQRCKEELVTMHGPIVVAIGLAIAIVKFGSAAADIKVFKFSIDCDYNMRSRVTPPRDNTAVGFNVAMSGLMSLREKGMSMLERFWEQSRMAKSETELYLKLHASHRLELMFANEAYKIVESGNRNLSDVNLSNLGRYPFRLTHQIADVRDDGTATVIYLCSVDDCMNYGLLHRIDDQEAKRFFDLVVRIIESIGEIRSDETLQDVVKRFI